jgi:hypothetical protein
MNKTIEVIVSPAGEVSINAVGFKGTDCEHASRFLEEALGVVTQKETKPEFYQQNKTKAQQRIGS